MVETPGGLFYLSSSFSIALFPAILIFSTLGLVFTFRIRLFTRNRNHLISYLRETLNKNYPKLWEKEYNDWFKTTEKLAYEKTRRRQLIVYSLIFLISINLFFVLKLFVDVNKEKSDSLPAGLIYLPFLLLSLILLSTLGPILSGRHADAIGIIPDKIIYSIFYIFPKIKKSLFYFVHEPIPTYYGDPRIIESLVYLKNRKRIRKLKIFYNILGRISDEQKIWIEEEVLKRYEEKGLSELLSPLNRRIDHQHFMLGDNSVVRIEKKHPPWVDLPPEQHMFPNDTYLLNPILAMELKSFLRKYGLKT